MRLVLLWIPKSDGVCFKFERIPIGPSVDNWRCQYFSVLSVNIISQYFLTGTGSSFRLSVCLHLKRLLANSTFSVSVAPRSWVEIKPWKYYCPGGWFVRLSVCLCVCPSVSMCVCLSVCSAHCAQCALHFSLKKPASCSLELH